MKTKQKKTKKHHFHKIFWLWQKHYDIKKKKNNGNKSNDNNKIIYTNCIIITCKDHVNFVDISYREVEKDKQRKTEMDRQTEPEREKGILNKCERGGGKERRDTSSFWFTKNKKQIKASGRWFTHPVINIYCQRHIFILYII